MSVPLIDRAIPYRESISSFANDSILLGGVLFILMLVVLRRHGLLYYGSKLTGLAGTLLFGLFISAFLFLGAKGVGMAEIVLILLIFSTELLLNSYGRVASTFRLLDVGLLIGMLTLYHISFIVLMPYYLFKAQRMEGLSARQTGAMLLGILGVWWLALLLTAPPSVEGVVGSLTGFFVRLTQISTFTVSGSEAFYIAYTVMLLGISLFYYNFKARALERHRFFLSMHLELTWMMFAFHLLYSYTGTLSVFLLSSLFFGCTILQVYYRTVHDKIWIGLMTISVLGALGTLIHTLTA